MRPVGSGRAALCRPAARVHPTESSLTATLELQGVAGWPKLYGLGCCSYWVNATHAAPLMVDARQLLQISPLWGGRHSDYAAHFKAPQDSVLSACLGAGTARLSVEQCALRAALLSAELLRGLTEQHMLRLQEHVLLPRPSGLGKRLAPLRRVPLSGRRLRAHSEDGRVGLKDSRAGRAERALRRSRAVTGHVAKLGTSGWDANLSVTRAAGGQRGQLLRAARQARSPPGSGLEPPSQGDRGDRDQLQRGLEIASRSQLLRGLGHASGQFAYVRATGQVAVADTDHLGGGNLGSIRMPTSYLGRDMDFPLCYSNSVLQPY